MRKRGIFRIIRIVWITAGVLSLIWLFVSYQAHGVDPAVLQNNQRVEVIDTAEALVFVPKQSQYRTGLVFLPGAMVDPLAYTPMARTVAEHGFKTVLVKLPYRMALTEGQRDELLNRIETEITKDGATERWVLGGHSRGAALAAQFVHQQRLDIDSLVLIATSHPKATTGDLSGYDLDVTKIYATHDGLASETEVHATSTYLPASTRWVRIAGGNHAQFGWYGSQIGDSSAIITREQQQALLLDALLEILIRVDEGGDDKSATLK